MSQSVSYPTSQSTAGQVLQSCLDRTPRLNHLVDWPAYARWLKSDHQPGDTYTCRRCGAVLVAVHAIHPPASAWKPISIEEELARR